MNSNKEVDRFLDEKKNPLRKDNEALRQINLNANKELKENIKWNDPNYTFKSEDRITMRIQPPKQVQLIFHRGAKVLEAPKDQLISEDFGILAWKGNDRAVASIKNSADIEDQRKALTAIVKSWVNATK